MPFRSPVPGAQYQIGGDFYAKLAELESTIIQRDNARYDLRPILNARLRRLRIEVARLRGTHTAEEWQAIIAEFDGLCVRCGADGVEKDHVIPVYQGGCDCAHNLQPLCTRCNGSKGADRTDWKAIRRREQ